MAMNTEGGFNPPRFSIFSLSSWITRLAGPKPNDQYYLLILVQYFLVSMGISMSVSSLLNASRYNHTGIMVFMSSLIVLALFFISYRKFIVIDSDIRTSSRSIRIFRRLALFCLHFILFYILLILARYPTTDMQLIASIFGSIWVVMVIVVRSQRKAPLV